jgi:DNA repair protein RecN (Recombination protein N)
MLYALSIKNFAIVERLELTFAEGLTIITGETGAGKSILVDALGLALGDRADSGVVRQGCEETEISAAFDAPDAALAWLREQGFDSEGECLARRVVAANGRSRAYINGHLATVQALRDLSEYLLDIHGQHAHQSLLKPDAQRQTLDSLLDDQGQALNAVLDAYRQWKALRQALSALGGSAADREAQLALLRYQVEELAALELSVEGLAELEEEHRRLAHASQLLEGAQKAGELLDNDGGPSVLGGLSLARRELEAVLNHDSRLGPIAELLDNAIIQAEEAGNELRHYLDHLEVDPARLQWVENRLAALQNAARKHRVTVKELPGHFERLREQLDALENYEERARQLESQLAATLKIYRQAAHALSLSRSEAAKRLAAQVTTNMQQLGMPKGRFVIRVEAEPDADPGPHGLDRVEFLVSANPGQDPRPLGKVASGGELSRISLALQVITAQHSGVPTLIFDEVDVGIGGGVAEIVGRQLAALGRQRQVLCITHLPQVAAYGQQHLQVRKTAQADSTQTGIHALDHAERVEEIARMLGGLEMTAQTLAHAREMLEKSAGRL